MTLVDRIHEHTRFRVRSFIAQGEGYCVYPVNPHEYGKAVYTETMCADLKRAGLRYGRDGWTVDRGFYIYVEEA